MNETTDRFYKGVHTLVWEPAAEPAIINHGYDDRAMTAIEKTFGPYPVTLKREDLRILQAMDLAGGHRPIRDLIEKIEAHGAIRIWLISGWNPDKQSVAESRPRRGPAAVADAERGYHPEDPMTNPTDHAYPVNTHTY